MINLSRFCLCLPRVGDAFHWPINNKILFSEGFVLEKSRHSFSRKLFVLTVCPQDNIMPGCWCSQSIVLTWDDSIPRDAC